MSYYLLKLLSWTGLIWDLRPVPVNVYDEARQLKTDRDPHA